VPRNLLFGAAATGAHSGCKGAGRLVLPGYTAAGACARALLPGLVLPPPGSGVETPLGQASALTTPGLSCFKRLLVRARRRSGHSSTQHVGFGISFHSTTRPHHAKALISTSPLQAGVPLCGFLPVEHGHSLDSFQLYAWTTGPVPLRSGWSIR
jgi:hypothetical protein